MDEQLRTRGMKVRRSVLGDAHVDRAEATKSALNEEFQDLLTRYAWGEIWSRPGLDRRTRSCITVAMWVALIGKSWRCPCEAP
jgi:alkylhydroperoxidase/carboxymuconolactone decarboxylase family protein YurZ